MDSIHRKFVDNIIEIDLIGQFILDGEHSETVESFGAHRRSEVVLYQRQFREAAFAAGDAYSHCQEDSQHDHDVR